MKERKEVRARSVRVAGVSLLVVSLILFTTTYILNQKSRDVAFIHQVTEEEVAKIDGAELADLTIVHLDDGKLEMDIVVRATQSIRHSEVEDLQEAIGQQLVAEGIIDEIAITMTVIPVTELDPLTPPTPTPGPSPTPEPTPVVEEVE